MCPDGGPLASQSDISIVNVDPELGYLGQQGAAGRIHSGGRLGLFEKSQLRYYLLAIRKIFHFHEQIQAKNYDCPPPIEINI